MGIAPVNAQSAAAVNKYLTQNPTAMPNAGSSFSNVQNPTTATPYTYVVTVDYGPSASGTVSISDTLPPGFVVTGCSAFLDATPMTVPGCPASGTIGTSIGPFPTSTSTGHRVTIYITGSFTVGGQVTNSATATVPAGTASGAVTSFIDTLPPTFNLSIAKTADKTTAAFGDTIVYTTTVTNTGTADLPMANVVAVYDRLTNTSTGVEMDVTWGWLNCTSSPASPPSTCLSAPLPQASPPTTLLGGQSLDIFSSSTTSTTGIGVDLSIAGGVLKVGASMTIQYYVTIETSDPCAPVTPSLKNRSYLGLGGSAGNFPDSNAADNAAEVSIPFTGLPTTCPPPPLKVTKTITSGPPSWGNWIVYEIEVTNISGVKVSLKYKDLVKGAPATTVFDADVNIASMNCISITCAHQYFTPQTWIGSAPKMLFRRQLSAGFHTMLPNASFKLIYKVKYDAVCAINAAPVIIQNQFDTRGFISTTPAQNFHMLTTHNAKMPSLPVCSMKVTKNWKPVPVVDPAVPAQFGTVIGTYQVKWTNASSGFGLKVGTMWDVMHTDNMLYAMVPVTYSSPTCTSSTGSPVTNLISATSANVSPTLPGAQWQGAQVIRIANKTFVPSESVSCEFTVTAQRPPASDPNCQAQGTPKLWNIALADLDPAYDPTTTPWKSATVEKRLPLCRNVTITKIATPAKVLAGDPVNWTLIFQNNGPAPNQPISFSSQDIVPPAVLPISSGPLCGFGTGGTTCATNLSAGTINTTISNLPAGQQIGVIFTTTSPNQPYQFVPNTVKALEAPGFYYHSPNPTATATLATGWPTVTKAFTPAKVFGPGQPVSLTFTVTNLSYKPAVSGMNFTDQLPTGMLPQPATLVGCGGSIQVNASGQVSLQNGVLASGAASCQFTVPVTYNRCGTFANTPANVLGVPVKIDTSGLSATLTVACLKAVTGNGIDTPAFKGHGCALYDSGDVKCWGRGPLGRTSLLPTALPVTGNQPADQIDSGPVHVCITTKAGNAQCWGNNTGGQIGIGNTVAQPLPGGLVKINATTNLANIVEVSAGGDTSCAVQAFGSVRTVWCWGRMATSPGLYAVQVPGITDAKSVSVSSTHVCVLRVNFRARCWGQNIFYQLGTGSNAPTMTLAPQAVGPSTLHIRSIKAGDGFTCILEGPFTVRAMCWGFNGAGTLANLLRTGATTTSVTVPSAVIATPANLRELSVTDSASGGRHMCVTHGSLRQVTCWGQNGNAQIGVAVSPTRPPMTGPVSVATATTVTNGFDASNGKTCAITGTGTTAFNALVKCWGSRALGAQLGDGLTTPSPQVMPVTVANVP